MQMDIHAFRAGHAADQAAVLDLILPIQQVEFGIAVSIEDQPDLLDIPHFYQTGAGNFWLASNADTVLGSIALLDIGAAQVALRKMFVAANFRGREYGVASKLLQHAVAWAKAHELRDIFLGTTEQFHAAHRFYEKNGFQKIAQQALPPNFPVMQVDTVFYHLSLQ